MRSAGIEGIVVAGIEGLAEALVVEKLAAEGDYNERRSQAMACTGAVLLLTVVVLQTIAALAHIQGSPAQNGQQVVHWPL